MSPLLLAIIIGHKDAELDQIITDLELFQKNGGISVGEHATLQAAYERLDIITRPKNDLS
jgi:hypothetical protein